MSFSDKDLRKMIVPLFFEQLLVLLVGIADTFMVSYAGEEAVSGVSLTNSFNTIFIYIFTALAAGGAVVTSQYIGREDRDNAVDSASQLYMISFLLGLFFLILVKTLGRTLLGLLFGSVDEGVMNACITYLSITSFGYPAIAVYNAGAASARAMGKTKLTMVVSMISNTINVIGNYIGVFVLKAGVAGVAVPTLISNWAAALIMTVLVSRKKNPVYVEPSHVLAWHSEQLKKILHVALPNGVENGVFQLVKVALSSIVALFGTAQIAANGIAQTIWSLAAIMGMAIGPVFITVIGQCMGAGKPEEAEKYAYKLLRWSLALNIVWCTVIYLITPVWMQFYAVSDETKGIVIRLVLIHNIFCAFTQPFMNNLGNGLRAAGDVRYTMVLSIISTIGVRLVWSYILGIKFNMGVYGIAFAMVSDWAFRAVVLTLRFRTGKWKTMRVI